MKSLWMAAPGRLEIREIPVPEIAPDEVLVRVEYAGICGSDLHIYHNTHSFRFPPVIVGHEAAGTVVSRGAAVTSPAVGERVAVLPMRTCGVCGWCRQDLPAHCPERCMPGQGAWIGACAEYLNVPARCCYSLPPGVDTRLGALCEPLAVAVHALEKIPPSRRGRVLMMGAGAIGHLAVIAAKAMGFERVIASDLVERNLELAMENGADLVIRAGREPLSRIEETYGEKADAIVITAGSQDILREAVAHIRHTGYIVVIAMPSGELPFPLTPFVFTEAVVCASQNYNDADFRRCLELLDREKERFSRAITHVVPFTCAQEMFDVMAKKQQSVIKAMFKVRP